MLDFSEFCLYLSLPYYEGFYFYNLIALTCKNKEDFMEKFISFIGIFVFLGICYLISENKKKVRFKLVFAGIIIQFIFAF